MYTTGTIRPDGSVSLDGFVPMKWRLLALTPHYIVIHSPGGTWWDNGGAHYGRASIEVQRIARLTPGNEEGSWRFEVERGAPTASFHPTPARAVEDVIFKLRRDRERIARQIEERTKR